MREYRPRRFPKKKSQRQFLKAVNSILDGSDEVSALTINEFAPNLWVSFLNADPEDADSMWEVYKEFIDDMEKLRDQLMLNSKDIRDMRFLSEDEFMEQYPLELKLDAEKLHKGMREVVDKKRWRTFDLLTRSMEIKDPGEEEEDAEQDAKDLKISNVTIENAEDAITGGALMPPVSFTLSQVLVEKEDDAYYALHLHSPSVNHRNFWLSIILTGILISDHNQEIRRCAAPDCDRYFIPSPYSKDQQYHSVTCRNRNYMRRWRNSKKKG